MKYSEKYLPNQKFYRNLNTVSKEKYEKNLYLKINEILKLSKTINHNSFFKTKLHNSVEMGSNPLFLNIVDFLINILKPKTVLEIGTFVGLFSTFLAKKNLKVTTIEKFKTFYLIAKKNFKKNNISKNIQIFNGDANNILDKLNKKFDLIFLDGDKSNYLNIFKKIEKNNLKKNSAIIVDDIFFHGDILNKKTHSNKGLGVKKFLSFIKKNDKFYKTILPIYGGILLLIKK
jgi:predicted O-methyltransferase YrrM